jgi:hypothetical protein
MVPYVRGLSVGSHVQGSYARTVQQSLHPINIHSSLITYRG